MFAKSSCISASKSNIRFLVMRASVDSNDYLLFSRNSGVFAFNSQAIRNIWCLMNGGNLDATTTSSLLVNKFNYATYKYSCLVLSFLPSAKNYCISSFLSSIHMSFAFILVDAYIAPRKSPTLRHTELSATKLLAVE